VLCTAAVLGGGIDWELLPLAGGWSEEEVAGALRAAVDAHLLVLDRDAPGGLRWRHALTRDAVLGRLLPPERAALARRAVAALDAGALAGDRAGLAIELHVLAGAGPEAARLLLAVARQAVDAGALRSAEDGLQRAIGLSGRDKVLSAELSVELVRVLIRRRRGRLHAGRRSELAVAPARAGGAQRAGRRGGDR
jgi:hypothetical protein